MGGPSYLGFDFFLDGKIPAKKWEKFIQKQLDKKYGNGKIIATGTVGRLKTAPTTNIKVWTLEEVEKEIENY